MRKKLAEKAKSNLKYEISDKTVMFDTMYPHTILTLCNKTYKPLRFIVIMAVFFNGDSEYGYFLFLVKNTKND